MKETKICKICGRELPLDRAHFHRNCHTQDGFVNECKDFKNKMAKERYHDKDRSLTQKGITRLFNRTLLAEGKKRCSHCGKILPMSDFYENHTRCMECERAIEHDRSYKHRFAKKIKIVQKACETANVEMTDDILKVGILLLTNKSAKRSSNQAVA